MEEGSSFAKRDDAPHPADLAEELMRIGRHCASLPDLDTRPADDILGYDDRGAW
jgi:hypothetical protein